MMLMRRVKSMYNSNSKQNKVGNKMYVRKNTHIVFVAAISPDVASIYDIQLSTPTISSDSFNHRFRKVNISNVPGNGKRYF